MKGTRAMGKKMCMGLLLLGGVLLCLIVPAGGQGGAGESCVTASCHVSFDRGERSHPPDTGCGACHQNIPADHAESKAGPPGAVDICVDCHGEVLEHRYIHAPVAEEKCHLCHDPHADMDNMLLPPGYSTRKFINYDEDAHSLCFSCHKRDLLMFPDTMFSTGFRDGARNLHYLHVNRESRGRSCKLCHAVHGADLPKMMATTIAFGNWQMPLHFEKRDNGGSCAPGCHEYRRYQRNIGP